METEEAELAESAESAESMLAQAKEELRRFLEMVGLQPNPY